MSLSSRIRGYVSWCIIILMRLGSHEISGLISCSGPQVIGIFSVVLLWQDQSLHKLQQVKDGAAVRVGHPRAQDVGLGGGLRR